MHVKHVKSIAACLAAACAAWPGHAAAQIRIAVVGPMTGHYEALGRQMRTGAEQAVADLNAAGVREAMTEGYTPGQSDYSALVGRMKAAGITAVYLGGYYAEAATIARQSKAAGLSAPIVGGDALVTDGFWKASGEAGAGTMMTFPADPRRIPAAAAVVRRFQARKVDPEGYTLYAYAAVQVWAQAAAKAASADGFKTAAALRSGTWSSVLGPVSFDRKGDVAGGGWVMYVWKAGSYQQM